MKEKAVVIFSGGMDSTVCLYWAKRKFDEVEAITFQYDQKHDNEVSAAKKICDLAKVRQKIVKLDFLPELVKSNLFQGQGNVNELNEKELPSSFVPNRNQLFITLAHAYAQKIGAKHLVTGVCQTDYSGYPDCRESFIKLIQLTTNEGSQENILIHTPLMHLDKAQTFDYAEGLGCYSVVMNLSQTCYNGDKTINAWGKGCGKCPACKLRENGWKKFKKRCGIKWE